MHIIFRQTPIFKVVIETTSALDLPSLKTFLLGRYVFYGYDVDSAKFTMTSILFSYLINRSSQPS